MDKVSLRDEEEGSALMVVCRTIMMKTVHLSPGGVKQTNGKARGLSTWLPMDCPQRASDALLNRWHQDHTFANEREWNLALTKQNKLIPKHLRTWGSPMKTLRGSLLGWSWGNLFLESSSPQPNCWRNVTSCMKTTNGFAAKFNHKQRIRSKGRCLRCLFPRVSTQNTLGTPQR